MVGYTESVYQRSGQIMKPLQKLDRIYLNILNRLQAHARISNQQLSEAVGLSPSPCLERVKKLEQEGYINGYHARVNLDKLCDSVTIIATVTLGNHKQDDFNLFEKMVSEFPEIVDCAKVSGSFDYVLRLVCTNMSEYDRVSDQFLNQCPEGIQLNSHVLLKEIKPFTGYPLEGLVRTD